MEEIKQRIILGLDVSTRCIGSTVASFDSAGNFKILEVSHLKLNVSSRLNGTKALFAKSELFKKKLTEKYVNYYITDVIIEEPLICSNNANVVASLMRFNGMISQTINDILGITPEYISSYDARKYAYPELMSLRKYAKNGTPYTIKKVQSSVKKNELVLFGSYPVDCSKKYILWNYISEKFPNIEWEYNKKGELKDENFDASDSVVCVLGYVNKSIYGDDEPVITKYKCYEDKIEYTVQFCGQSFDKTITFG